MSVRNKNVANASKFGKRKITSFDATSTIKLQSIDVSTINGVSIAETERTQEKQVIDIQTSKDDILNLQSKVLILENYVYDLRQIISSLLNKTI